VSNPKRYTQADYRQRFGDEVASYFVVESALRPGEIQINQYASRLVGPFTPARARQLAANLIAAANAIEGMDTEPGVSPNERESIDEQHDALVCPACEGLLVLLGALGNRRYYRCSDCGIDSSTEIAKP
jgi:hypothetical protein